MSLHVLLSSVSIGSLLLVAGYGFTSRKIPDNYHGGMQEHADLRGWRFAATDVRVARWAVAAHLKTGRRVEAHDVVEGVHEGRPFTAFHLVTMTGTVNPKPIDSCAVVTVRLGLRVPSVSVEPLRPWRRFVITTKVPAFRRAFRVVGESHETALDVLAPALRAWFVEHRGWWTWRLHDDHLTMFRRGTQAPEEIDAVLSDLAATIALVPASAWTPTAE